MRLSNLDDILWAATFAGYAALLVVLLVRGRWRGFPVFTTYIGFQLLLNTAGYLLHGSRVWYARVYWSGDVLDFLLQLGLVLEMSRIVLRPTRTWVQDARRQFLLWGGVGVLVAGLLAWSVSPPGLKEKAVWEVRASLFTSLVTCELVMVMALSATRMGLGWRSHVIALGEGLAVWAIVSVAVDAVQSYRGGTQQFAALDHLRMAVYCLALGYWGVQFWRQEPARRPISAAMRNYLLALHERASYDSDRLDWER